MTDPASKGRLPTLDQTVCPLYPAAKMTYNTYMENLTLSPKTQSVLDAANQAYDQAATVAQGTSAALRAAAMQTLLTSEQHEGSTPNDYELGWNAAVAYIQTIARELETL